MSRGRAIWAILAADVTGTAVLALRPDPEHAPSPSDPATDQFDIFKDDAKLNTEARTRK
jgi:hypothetical protein